MNNIALQDRLKSKGKTLKGIANELGLSYSYVLKVSRGLRRSVDVKHRIADALDTTFEDLWSGKDQKTGDSQLFAPVITAIPCSSTHLQRKMEILWPEDGRNESGLAEVSAAEELADEAGIDGDTGRPDDQADQDVRADLQAETVAPPLSILMSGQSGLERLSGVVPAGGKSNLAAMNPIALTLMGAARAGA